MNPENIDLTRHRIPPGYRLANAVDRNGKRTSEDWLFFTPNFAWARCSGLVYDGHWTYLVPITKRKAGK